MPELPDVEGFRAVLAAHAGETVRDVEVADAAVLRGVGGRAFAQRLRGVRLGTPWRYGKWLIAPARGARAPVLALHFGMTGGLVWCPDDTEPHRHDRVALRLPGGRLAYRDMRKLQGIRLTDDDGVRDLLAPLGPDACAITAPELADVLAATRRQIKPALMDQSVIAGLGNLLADEICWRARLDPRRRTDRVERAEARRLHARMNGTLRSAIRARRVPDHPSWLTGHREDDPGQCPRCGTALAHTRIGGRATVSCPHCQPA